MSRADDQDAAGSVNCAHCGHEIGTNGSPDMIRPIFDTDPEDQAYAVLLRGELARKIHVNCGSCGRGLKVSVRMAGRKTTCPACGKRVRLPLAGQEIDRRLEELIAKRSAQYLVAETEDQTAEDGAKAPTLAKFDESDLAELATYVETDDVDDDSTLDIPEDDYLLMRRSAEAIEGREILALNAAISAVAPRTTAAEDLPALQKAVKQHAPVRSNRMSGQRMAIIGGVAAAPSSCWAAITGRNPTRAARLHRLP